MTLLLSPGWINYSWPLWINFSWPESKGQGGYWTAALLRDGKRDANNVQFLSLLVFDCDAGKPWDDLKDYLELLGLQYCLHETASSTDMKPRWRCVIPLKDLVDLRTPEQRKQWQSDYTYLADHFARKAGVKLDACLKQPGQPIYWGQRQSYDAPERKCVYSTEGLELKIAHLLAGKPKVRIKLPVVNVTVPDSESHEAAKKWLRKHPCPQGQGERHTWAKPAICSLMYGIGLTPELTQATIIKVTGLSEHEVHSLVSWWQAHPTSSNGWLVAGKRKPEDIDALLDKCLIDAWTPAFTSCNLGEKTGLSLLDVERGRNRPSKRSMQQRRNEAYQPRDSVPNDLVRAAYDTIKQAKKWRKVFREIYKSHGIKEQPKHSCGFEQALADAVEVQSLGTKTRTCNILSCPACGPRLVAQHAAAALLMPCAVKDANTGHWFIVGTSLGVRSDIYRWILTGDKAIENFKKRFRRRVSQHIENIINVLLSPTLEEIDGVGGKRTLWARRASSSDTPPLYLMLQTVAGTIVYCTEDLSPGSRTIIHPTVIEDDRDGDSFVRPNPEFMSGYLSDITAAIRVQETTAMVFDDDVDISAMTPKVVTFRSSTPQHMCLDPQTLIRWASGSTKYAISDKDDEVADKETTQGILESYGVREMREVKDDETGNILYVGGLISLDKWDDAASLICRKRVGTQVFVDDGVPTTQPTDTKYEAASEAELSLYLNEYETYPKAEFMERVKARVEALE